jgi:hypothetical protein
MVYGIISLFVVTTLWGLVYFVGDVVGIDIRKNEGNFYESIDNNNPTSGLVNDGGFTESINGTNNQGTVNTNNMIDLYDNQIETKNPLINTLQGGK